MLNLINLVFTTKQSSQLQNYLQLTRRSYFYIIIFPGLINLATVLSKSNHSTCYQAAFETANYKLQTPELCLPFPTFASLSNWPVIEV